MLNIPIIKDEDGTLFIRELKLSPEALELYSQFFQTTETAMKPDGELLLSTPYPGSTLYWQDPTHCNGFNQTTFQYFDPVYPLYKIYQPKPWKIREGFPLWQANGNLEVIMEKMNNGSC